jgi:RNA polymerase sigma-70 factor (ECF subfamily)
MKMGAANHKCHKSTLRTLRIIAVSRPSGRSPSPKIGAIRRESGMTIDRERTRWFLHNILPHEPALRAWLSRCNVAGMEPDDVIQEAYAILAGLDTVDTIQHPRAYLYQIARSLITRHLRRARIVSIQAVADLDRLDQPDDAPSPEQCAIGRDELRNLERAIAAMPRQAREAFILRRVQGLPQREIAARMRLSESTVEKHISRGVRFLIDWFGRGGNACFQTSKGTGSEIATIDDHARVQSQH